MFLLISIMSLSFITHAAHISRVKFNNINNSSSSSDNENFRNLTPFMIYVGYSETFEVEMNWNTPDYRPDRVQLWIDLNSNSKEDKGEYFNYNTGFTGNSGTKVNFRFQFSIPNNVRVDVSNKMKISMVHVMNFGLIIEIPTITNSELYNITFRAVNFPHIIKSNSQNKTTNDPNPDFLVNFSLDSKTDSKVSFDYVKGTRLPGVLYVKRENSSIVPKYVRVYIDFDKNGSFSSTEKIFDYTIPVWSNNVLTKTETYVINVPTSKPVTLNSAYKFKVEVVDANGLGEAQLYSLYFRNSYIKSARIGEEHESDVTQIYNSNQFEENLEDVLIYPNPANDNFSISYFSNENYEININLISETGQSRFQKNYIVYEGKNIINISTESLPKGLYIVGIIGNNGFKVHKKMVIQ